ncbi:MAG: Crp/Fnr family transcriptional regulator [Saprospiraceae bacterium]|nr:Crp/Fnr family transcriptional regulator [Saprospiraceae bacterium]MCB9344187.1 Crp/Fnr family transcriptional regulator [Lewinellaceae bacterium]
MEKDEIAAIIHQWFPLLGHGNLAQSIAEKSGLIELPAGKVLLDTGSLVHTIPLVTKGSIKVIRADEDGHEILLYYIQPGESCAMTLSACLKQQKSKVKAITQEKTEIIALPADLAYMLGRQHPNWLDFILESYALRFDELLNMVDEIGFASLDQRLIKYLHEKSTLLNTVYLHVSHQEIADDLGTARAVISRLLKQMERKGMLKLLRGRIKISSLVLPE